MKLEFAKYLILIFIFYPLLGSGVVCAQGFHHPPPPPPPHHHQETPVRPPPRPPTRVIPPPRPEAMRPPSESQKMLHQWKNEVVDRVRDIANDHFGFDEETDWIDIEDPWAEENWGEWDESDASFQNHNFEVKRYRMKPIPVSVDYVNPNYPDYPDVTYSFENGSLAGFFPDTFSIDGSAYTLDTLPAVVKDMYKDSMLYLPIDNPNLRFIVVYGDGQAGITVIAVNQLAPGVYNTLDVIKSYADIPHTFVNGDQLVEVSPEWKDVNIISLAHSEFTEVTIETTNININDYNAPEPVAPLQQPEVVIETPVVPEATVVDNGNNPQPTTFAEQGQQTEEMISFDHETSIEPPIPTVTDLIKIDEDVSIKKWEKILAPKEQLPREELRALTDPEPQYQLRAQHDPEPLYQLRAQKLPREELTALPSDWKPPTTVEEKLKTTFDTVALTAINVEFPLVGMVISGGQGFKSGWDKARKGGGDIYQTIWNAGAGAVTNLAVGAVAGKAGGAVLGKLPVGEKFIKTTNSIVSDQISGKATESATDFKPAVVPAAVKYFIEGVPDNPSEYAQNLDPGTYGAHGGLVMRSEYEDL